MICNNPSGCDCANQKFCKWFGAPKKPKGKGGFKKQKTPLKRTRLKPRSVKQASYTERYQQIKEVWLVGKKCAVFPSRDAEQTHHIKGRSVKEFADEWAMNNDVPLLIDERFFLPVTQDGHDHIHKNTVEAREKGWLL